jgi:hypothetical protein
MAAATKTKTEPKALHELPDKEPFWRDIKPFHTFLREQYVAGEITEHEFLTAAVLINLWSSIESVANNTRKALKG